MPVTEMASIGLPPAPSEAWTAVFFPPAPLGHIGWAVGLVVPGAVPESWEYGGNYLFGVSYQGSIIVGVPRRIPIIRSGGTATLNAIDLDMIPFGGAVAGSYFCSVSVHRWIPRVALRLFSIT